MKKLLLAAVLAFLASPALAQNIQCPDRPAGDSTNACANTRFVMSNAGLWILDGTTVVNNSPNGYTTVRISRSNTGDAGATLMLGHGAYQWQLIGNQLAGGDLIMRSPAGDNVLVLPQTGACLGIQNNITACAAMLDVGGGAGTASVRLNGATFTNNAGPLLTFAGNSAVIARLGNDCVTYGATACSNDFFIRGPASSRVAAFTDWAAVRVITTSNPNPTQYVGGPLTVIADSANAFAGGNGVTAQVNVTTSGQFPSVYTALANVTVGPGTVWGLYSHCDLHAAVECASVEGTAANLTGSAANVPPIATVPNPTQPFITGLKATCGAAISPVAVGTNGCSVGVWVHYYEGNGGWPFLYGAYFTEGVATTTGIHVNADSLTPMLTAAEFRSAGGVGQRGVVIRNMGASSGNLALDFQNNAGATVGSIAFNGVVSFTNGGVIQGLTDFRLADASGFLLRFRSISAPAQTANRILTFDVSDADRTIDLAGNLTIGGAFSTASTFTVTAGAVSIANGLSTTGTFSSGGNFSTSSTFSVTGALSIGGAFTTTSTVSITGAFTTAAAFTTSGANSLTLTTTGATNVTLPTSGTLAALGGTNTWTATNTFNVSTVFGTGAAAGQVLNVINGGTSGASGGGALSLQNGGSTTIGIGGKSAFLGTGYDATPIIFMGTSPVIMYGGADRIFFYSSGGIALNTSTDPGAGMLYTNSASFMIRTKTSYTNGAGAGGGTITNAPAAGNPTKWIPVDDNGTTRYVPAW